MHEIVVISGKGGAGKTSVTGAFAHLADNAILCDLDVDAPDLHLLLAPKVRERFDFSSGNEAVIDPQRCEECGLCETLCRYKAISHTDTGYEINKFLCEGCKLCVVSCPAEAIDFPERHCGERYVSSTRFGTMVHAQLFPGEENSGRLVTLLKQEARRIATESGVELMLCDGAPGIGCPVISSLAGTDLAVLVTEPTPSGRHDLERVAELCTGFRTKVAVIINKFDLNLDQTKLIEDFCEAKGYAVVCRLPHSNEVTAAMVKCRVITEIDTPLAELLRQAWNNIVGLLPEKKSQGEKK